jgi:dTDP-4-amino-4,6-dideoxygalactose transaminase
MHMQPVFSAYPFYGTGVCEELFEKGLCMPSGSNLGEADFERIFSALNAVFRLEHNK